MSEQQTTSACPHPEAVGTRWGDPISEERQTELQGYLDRWEAETDHGERKGPFDVEPSKYPGVHYLGVPLCGADVFWLVTQVLLSYEHNQTLLEEEERQRYVNRKAVLTHPSRAVPTLHLGGANLEGVHLEGAMLAWAHLEGAYFYEAHLEGADLQEANLARSFFFQAYLNSASLRGAELGQANLNRADLEGANLEFAGLKGINLDGLHLRDASLRKADLEGASLSGAYLERANLEEANLKGANLDKADLRGAKLDRVHLEQGTLEEANLENASLRGAHLEGTLLTRAYLERANICNGWMDKSTQLNNARLDHAFLDQTTFDNTNLSVVDWKQVTILGDELTAQAAKDAEEKRKSRQQRITDYQAAVRAYRRLAVALQANGLSTESANYLYRASIMQRRLARHERHAGAYFFSVLLAVLAGYGYRLGRILIAYIVALVLFASAYFAAGAWLGATHLEWYEALLVSLTAIHGRVFITTFGLDSIQACIAAVESVVGIVIEGVFVAMLIQRFFGR